MARSRASRAFRVLLALVAAIVVATWVRAALLYPAIPERFPIHFDAGGRPDRWATRSIERWFMLPAVALAIEVLLLSIAWWGRALVARAPGIVNMPRKATFVRLSPEGRLEAFEPTRAYLAFVVLLLALLFWYLLEGTAQVASGARVTLPTWPVLAFLGGVLGSLAPILLVTTRRIEGIARREGVGGTASTA